MQVTKRDGRLEPVQFDKITQRLRSLCTLLSPVLDVDVVRIAASVCASVHDGISTARLDELAADVAAGLVTEHPDYGLLGARILVSNLQKNTSDSVLDTYEAMAGVLDPEFLQAARTHAQELQAMVDYTADYDFDFFGFKTVERMYLTRVDGRVVERPQHMWLRVALALWGDDLEGVRQTYEHMRRKHFTHASPTLFNAGMRRQQLSSCYLLGVEDDSIDGIFDAITKCARISKYGGGIGLHVSGVRAKGARIRGTNGESDGLVPMLRVVNGVAAYVNQGGRRKGSVAIYLEPHHPDLLDFLALKRNSGDEHLRARDLFYALWVPDLFMRRVEANGTWSFFDPSACPGLADAWGDEYEALYERYEAEGLAARQVAAQDVWFEILRSQIETGTPYVLYKDACNAKSNQQNLGTIKCSNLCAEIVEFTAPDEVAVCNLGSLSLPSFVLHGAFDFEALAASTRVLARNLDRVIDVSYYPVPEARRSNLRHRPVGIGVQGLQDVFFELGLPFDSPEAAALNKRIFETLYFAAISESCSLAQQHGAYSTFAGSPASQGRLQFDLWGVTPESPLSWETLKRDVAQHGLRNSLSVAPMPTASTASIFGNVESTEPITSNLYSRRTLAGEFAVVNGRLVRELARRGLWTRALKNEILARDGSVQGLAAVPEDVQRVYKTAWELSQKAVIDMAADRGPFVCQSQSMNLFVAEPTFKKLSSMHFYAWKRGLKTGIYYLRTRPAARAVQITVDPPCASCSA
jgi:ribonucleoside-diphosphate reductase alpha subunit